jgi:transcriptional regulator with XRE-family HTH domain
MIKITYYCSMELTNVEILETARKRAGLTQTEIAKSIGVSLPTWTRWLRGNFDDVLLIHAHTLEELLKVKFTVIHADNGKKVKIILM